MGLFQSKKFLQSLIGVFVGLVGHYGLDIDPGALFAILSPILMSIGGQAASDSFGKGKVEAQSKQIVD